jgi:hypothetical protein
MDRPETRKDRAAEPNAIFNLAPDSAKSEATRQSLRNGEKLVALTIEEMLPSAKQAMQKLAAAQAEEATTQMHRDAKAAAEKKALIERLQAPSGLSDDEAVRRAIKIIERAIGDGLVEIQVYRFPNTLCTDGGRAINQQESGWEATLTGVPREIDQLGQVLPPARLHTPGRDHQLSRRHAGRRRHDAQVGLNNQPNHAAASASIESRCHAVE